LGDIENSYRVPEDTMQIAAHLQLSKDGRFILVSNRGRHNSISIFQIVNAAEGKIQFVETVSTQGYFPRFFTLIEDKYLLVANQVSNLANNKSLIIAKSALKNAQCPREVIIRQCYPHKNRHKTPCYMCLFCCFSFPTLCCCSVSRRDASVTNRSIL
jgi:hypothetical protein